MSLVEDALKRHRAAAQGLPTAGATRQSAGAPAGRNALDPPEVPSDLPLAQVDHAFLESAGYSVVSPNAPAMMSQFRNIKRQLLQILSDKFSGGLSPVVAITSAVPGDGKSFFALNLANVLALEKQLAVTVVDYDPYRRNLSRMFGVASSIGLLDQIAAGSDARLPAFIHPTSMPRLHVLAAGADNPDAPELLCSPALEALLASMRSRKGQIHLFDCPPILATADAPFLATRADVTVLVVRAGVTSAHAVDEALARIKQAQNVCLVLNARTGSIAEGYYGYADNYAQYTSSSAT
jgi:receptor protein-tyrosine kinase